MRITVAPYSASIRVMPGPASTHMKSRILMPSSGNPFFSRISQTPDPSTPLRAPAHPPGMPSDDPPLPEAGKFTLVQLELADEDLTVVFTHRRRQPPKGNRFRPEAREW